MGLPRLPHLLGIEGLAPETISGLLDLSENYIDQNRSIDKRRDMLAGRTVINLFFENSTRTRTSFEVAAKRLGSDVINMDVATSSVRKGETLLNQEMALSGLKGLVVLDGNWAQAKALWWRNAWLTKLRRFVVVPDGPSLYGNLRQEARPDAVSTLEAVALALSALEDVPDMREKILVPFRALIAKARAAGVQGGKRDRRRRR